MRRARVPTMKSAIPTIDTRTVAPPPKQVDDFYNSPQWRQARNAAIDRDHNRCVRPGCGRSEKYMFVDHVKERRDGGAPFDLSNLETLCGSHHTSKTLQVRGRRMAE